MKNLPLFKIRASQVGRIMSEPRSKAKKEAGELSETTKTYVHEWLVQQLYGVKKELTNKEVLKGIQVEDDSIETYGLFKEDFYIKNEEFFEDEHITGTPDIITPDLVIDIKNSWDCFTFPLYDDKVNAMYYWQLQAYMSLTAREKAKLVYCLMNTPLELRYSELDHTDYNELPLSMRFKEFDITAETEKVDKIRERVEQIRNYIKTL